MTAATTRAVSPRRTTNATKKSAIPLRSNPTSGIPSIGMRRGGDKTFRPPIRSDTREMIATIAAKNPSSTRSWNLYHSGGPLSIERTAIQRPV